MLIESMGTNIINTSDSKGRWETLVTALVFGPSWHHHVTHGLIAGPPFTPRPFPTTWSASPCC